MVGKPAERARRLSGGNWGTAAGGCPHPCGVGSPVVHRGGPEGDASVDNLQFTASALPHTDGPRGAVSIPGQERNPEVVAPMFGKFQRYPDVRPMYP
jgi:hypothetical protein